MPSAVRPLALALMGVLTLPACGSSNGGVGLDGSAPPSIESGGVSAGGDDANASLDGGAIEAAAREAASPPGEPCPPTVPTAGTPCATAAQCSWGNHPAIECRVRGTCSNGSWTLYPAPLACTQMPAGCPSSAPDGICTDTTLQCVYPDGADCGCFICCNELGCGTTCGGQPQGTKVWQCTRPAVPTPPCPSLIPNEGTPCSISPETPCLANSCGLNVSCDGEFWRWDYVMTGCAPSVVCASPDTPIATPEGERAIADIRVGDIVYGVDRESIRAVVVVRVGKTSAAHHHVVRVQFEGGRRLEISAPHPTADGRTFGELRAGDELDGRLILSAEIVPYDYDSTYDILPGSETGTYFAAGIPIGSTLLARQPITACCASTEPPSDPRNRDPTRRQPWSKAVPP